MKYYDATSSVEAVELKRSGRRLAYAPTEKIPVIEIESYPLLGKLTALRFIEWVLKNPGGVISLPSGKTPEMFIRWTSHILEHWAKKEVHTLLADFGIDSSKKPDMKSLTFVQIDEFYPMDAHQHNSFNYYVKEFYIKKFGLDLAKALLIDATSLGLPAGVTMQEIFPGHIVDLDLRVRHPRTALERTQKEVIGRVDMFCTEYETKIRDMGGIGFFLGGIGPDGHIAFNVRGSSAYSVTRLTGTNYETQAAAASDLGGIEISRNRLVITVGLATITCNPSATVIIMAAGDTKLPVVRQAIEEDKHQLYPASVLQGMEHSRFYLTRGIACRLSERRLEDFCQLTVIDSELSDEVAIGISLARNKPLLELTKEDFEGDPLGRELLRKSGIPHHELARAAHQRIGSKINNGLAHIAGTTFLHTEPHQDDIMLSYLSYLYHLVRDPSNKHHFANLTSGFTSVSNPYFLSIINKLRAYMETAPFFKLYQEGYFSPGDAIKRMEDVYLFLDGSAARSREKKDEAEARRLMRDCIETFRSDDLKVIGLRLKELEEYLATQYPGAKDPPDIQTLKGTLREWESELLWAYFGIEASDVHALRLGFYQGDIFSEEPQVNRDVLPIFELLKTIRPGVISVAFDPEASGPDTHYKALQAVAEAIKLFEKEDGHPQPKIWGYRNVWHRFKPSEANCIIPVSLNTLSLLHTAFMNCFGSQSAASFPSYEHDGPFSELAQKIQVEQYGMIKTCLGKDFFLKHEHPRLRAARGMIFLKEMDLAEFFQKVRELKKVTEAI
jgi:glucosamine-6-phosphate deaminase